MRQIYRGQIPSNHLFCRVNAATPADFEKIAKLYLEKGEGKPVYIVHEGMLPYFSEAEQEILRESISAFLREHAPQRGFWVTSDFNPLLEKKSKKENTFKKILKALALLVKKEGRVFEDDKMVEEFLSQSDLTFKTLPNSHIIESLDTLKKPGLTPEDLSGPIKNYRAFVVTPRP